MKISVIGAGAAGCICAIELKRRLPDADVCVFESGKVPLAKVALTGGGRCNLTNDFKKVDSLRDVYPRGFRLMERLLKEFGPEETMDWFRREGVRLKVEDEGRIFPYSDDAMQIVRTLENLMRRTGVNLVTSHRIGNINELDSDFKVVATGGNSLDILDGCAVKTVPCVPSLFTFRIPDRRLCDTPGVKIDNVGLHIPGFPGKSSGPIITTHWGISGPAVLKLSSYAARFLAEKGYRTPLCINWLGDCTPSLAEDTIRTLASEYGSRMVRSTAPDGIPSAIWKMLLEKCSIREDIRWNEMGGKSFNKLRETLVADLFQIDGRAPFKDEFVSCGGVDLSDISSRTLESKRIKGLFFAGEALDIDGITGGFNLQAAWTTGYIAAKSITESKNLF